MKEIMEQTEFDKIISNFVNKTSLGVDRFNNTIVSYEYANRPRTYTIDLSANERVPVSHLPKELRPPRKKPPKVEKIKEKVERVFTPRPCQTPLGVFNSVPDAAKAHELKNGLMTSKINYHVKRNKEGWAWL